MCGALNIMRTWKSETEQSGAYNCQVHLEELESAESAERTMSGHDENVEALPYRCM